MNQSGLEGHRVLVVEDDLAIAMGLEAVLADAGYQVVGPVGWLSQALQTAERETLDAALLDVNLSGERVFPLADALMDRGVPFIFLTGYGTDGLPDRYRRCPTLTKPYRPEALLSVLAQTVAPDEGTAEA